MRHIISLLLVILLLSLPAMAQQSFSPCDFVTHSADEGKYICYEFPDVSLFLPASWEGRFIAEQDDYGMAFYQSASYEKYLEEGQEGGGFLFRLGASEDESFRDLLAYEYLGYSENAGMHFYLTLPPEYTAYPEDGIMADYEDMAGAMETIIEMARIAPGASFYTDDFAGTDDKATFDEARSTATHAVQGNYSGVTTLDAPAVEAFAARVRQLYLSADWDAMAQLINYPITLYPDVKIDDANAFAAFMADKTISDSDIAAMTAESCAGMMSNGQGICMGSGQIWLRDIAFDGIEQTGEPDLRVIALSGLTA